jgi:Na+/H+ antiporter NhaC
VVAILVTGDFARSVGERFGIDRYRRSNLLDVTVCTYPFLLPYFIPTILIASTTQGAEAFGMPRLSAVSAGLWNFYSWGLLTVLVGAILTGWGRGPSTRVGFFR